MFDFSQGLRQEFGVGREVLTQFQRAAEIGHCHDPVGPEIRRDELGRRLPGASLIGNAHAGRIEEEHHVLLVRARSGRAAFQGEARHHLFLFVFPDPEILGCEIANVVSFLVRDDRIHQNQLGFRSDDVSGIGGRIGFGD